MKYSLSKSRYCTGVNCLKALWLKENRPEEYDCSVMNENVLNNGNAVGDYAMQLFGEFTEVPYDKDLSTMIQKTQQLVKNGTKVICEGSFSYDNCFCSVDILKNLGNSEVELYEVKSCTTGDNKTNKAKKELYKNDIAFQTYVLIKLGFKVKKSSLVTLNNQYVRHGEINIEELFNIIDVTEVVQPMLTEVEEYINLIRKEMELVSEPDCRIGKYCFAPYNCGFYKYCSRCLPSPNIFDVGFSMTLNSKLKLFEQGIVSYEDLYNQQALKNEKQIKQVDWYLHNKEDYVDKTKINQFINGLSYPLYFLDFEGVQYAIPEYENTKPYQQICFQYSLHYVEKEDGEVLHKEFLAYPGKDPRRELCEHLCKDIPEDSCVLVYNQSYEGPRIKEMAALFPDLEEKLLKIEENLVDLAVPFRNLNYYSRSFGGSYSIKVVLPGLFPNEPSLDYHSLEGVHNGSEATQAFIDMHHMTPEELELKRTQLLKYCGLDTFAMVKIWEKLKEVCRE